MSLKSKSLHVYNVSFLSLFVFAEICIVLKVVIQAARQADPRACFVTTLTASACKTAMRATNTV